MKQFKRILNPGLVPCGRPIKKPMFCKVEIEDGRLSISGVIDPWENGNCGGGCGQIDMEFSHRDPAHDDKRTHQPIKPEQIDFSDGWNRDLWLEFLVVWHDWHLNDMQSGCEHQREMGWTYDDHHDPKTFKGEKCPVCGYSIGSQWLKKELPKAVVQFLMKLPETKVTPAWV